MLLLFVQMDATWLKKSQFIILEEGKGSNIWEERDIFIELSYSLQIFHFNNVHFLRLKKHRSKNGTVQGNMKDYCIG